MKKGRDKTEKGRERRQKEGKGDGDCLRKKTKKGENEKGEGGKRTSSMKNGRERRRNGEK